MTPEGEGESKDKRYGTAKVRNRRHQAVRSLEVRITSFGATRRFCDLLPSIERKALR